MLTLKIWVAILLSSALPFLALVWLWRRKAKGWLDWVLASFIVGALTLATFIATPWAMTSYYLRLLLPLLFIVALYLSFRKLRETSASTSTSTGSRLSVFIRIVILLPLLALDALAVSTYFYRVAPVEMAFPLSGGVFYVIQGGNSVLTNPFHKTGPDNQEAYALDIVKLKWTGNRATGIYPDGLTSYAVYQETIYSPCDGEVIELLDGISENLIGEEGHSPSNHLVIRCKGVRVTLAHMTSGTFLVQKGQFVQTGQPLAKDGNAGHTSEPHLHMDVVRDTTGPLEPVPMSFDGRVLAVNSIVRK